MTHPSLPANRSLYPGSKQEIRRWDTPADPEEPVYFGEPKVMSLKGEPTEFYSSGQLAAALNRKPVTMRLWERQGTIPHATFTLNRDNRYAKRRLYTRAQVEGLRQLAIEEGILSETSRHITKTNFASRAEKLFKELENG